jgi:glutamine amidotransferase
MYVSIVDYGTGNLNSVSKAVEVAGLRINEKVSVKISNKPQDILNSDRIILPGQGSYRQCVLAIKNINGLWEAINEFVLIKKRPIFGICVGMQIFSEEGFEEEKTQGFGWLSGSVKRIILKDPQLKLPHMGWNEINILNKHSLFDGIENLSDYYFAHSYYFDAKNKADIVCSVKYEEDLVAAILKDNIFGTQFHPEKSHENGIKLLSNFLNWKIK